MVKFLVGFVSAVIVVVLAAFCFVRFGFVDPRADTEAGTLETKLAMPALDASVDRRAPDIKNPLQPTDDNLMAGMKVYQSNCASCHGDPVHRHTQMGDGFYPRAPQFVEDAADMPENQNFYIILHGVRLSGMPAWKQTLTEPQIWQVTTFLSHMDQLPAPVGAAWSAAAGVAASGEAAAPAAKTETKDKMSMHM